MNKIKIHMILLLAVLGFTACDDYLDVKPKDRLIPTTADDFRALMTSAYNGIPQDKGRLSFRTDEVKLNESKYDLTEVQDIYLWNDVNFGSKTLPFSWQQFYKAIMYANHVIDEGLDATEGTKDEINQIVGEAYMLRALMHFNLVNQYGKPFNTSTASSDKGIPLSLEIDTEAKYPANTVAEVYEQIMADVEKANELINVETQEKGYNYRFSKVAVLAFQSRMFLYMGDIAQAKSYALEVLKIKNALLDLVADASAAPHRYDSVESILALEDVTSSTLNSSALLSDKMKSLYNQDNDLRFGLNYKASENIDGEFTIKRSDESATKCTFRTAEMFLTVAECAARQNDLDEARNYLNQLKAKRLKADFYTTEVARIEALGQDALIAEIMNERLREFAFEGHRWFDLRRTTQDEIVHVYKSETATLQKNDPRYTLRYPQEATDNNPLLSN
jgi:hypothetical protein